MHVKEIIWTAVQNYLQVCRGGKTARERREAERKATAEAENASVGVEKELDVVEETVAMRNVLRRQYTTIGWCEGFGQ